MRSFTDLIHNGLAGALVTAGAAVVVLVFLRGFGGSGLSPALSFVCVLAAGLLGGLIQGTMVRSGGAVATAFVAPSGSSTAYTPTFSHIQALEMRGDLDAAERAWEAECAANPGHALVWVKAADFHARLRKNATAALAKYRHVQALTGASSDLARYASQMIVDLHLGPLAEPGRAMVEMRRLIERFPNTREATEARAALARMKAERFQN